MTPADRHALLTAIVISLDELAAIFMRLDREVRELLQAEFEPGPNPDRIRAEAELAALNPYPIRRSR